jgi:hypothetical protein
MGFDQDLEVAGRLEAVEGGGQGAFRLIVKPLADELVELLLLPEPLQQLLFIVQPDRGRCGATIDEQIRLAIATKACDGFLEFVLGAGFIARSVGARELGRQLRAEARPENCDDDVGLGRLDDLMLKG